MLIEVVESDYVADRAVARRGKPYFLRPLIVIHTLPSASDRIEVGAVSIVVRYELPASIGRD